MAIKLHVDALQAGKYDASLISDLRHFLASYDGLTLFEHLVKHDNYLDYFNQTFIRFATLAAEQSLTPNTKALYGAVLKDGFAILVHRLVQDISTQALSEIIKHPNKSFSILNDDILSSMMPLLDDFIPEAQIPEMLRHENLLQNVAHIIQPYSTLYDLSQATLQSSFIELAKDSPDSKHLLDFSNAIGCINIDNFSNLTTKQIEEHLFLLHIMYQSANESLRNDIAHTMDAFITRYAKDNHTLKVILNSVLPSTMDTKALLPQLSAASIEILMKAGVHLLENDQAKIFYHQQLTLRRSQREFTLTREAHANNEQWQAACLLAIFFSLPHVTDIKKILIPISTLTDYGDSHLKFIITSPKVIFTLMDLTPAYSLELASPLAYFNNYSTSRPLYLLDVTKLIPTSIPTLVKQLIDFGIYQIRLSSTVKQPTSTLFTSIQDLFSEPHCKEASLYYHLSHPASGPVFFDVLIKPTGILPGTVTMTTLANKKTCADFFVKALPLLLPQLNGALPVNNKHNNPYLLNIDVDKNAGCLNKLQQTLSEPNAPPFLWILFSNAQAGVNEYTYDIFLYKDCIEAGYFTRSGCGNIKLLKQHMPSIADHNAATYNKTFSLGSPAPHINPMTGLMHNCTSTNKMELS